MKKLIYILGLITAVAFMTSCEDRSDLSEPSASVTGTADFSSFVTIGNSLTAGYQNGSLYQTAQEFTIGNMITGQLFDDDLAFEQPLYSDPGTGNRMELQSLEGPVIVYNTETGAPLNLEYPAPYNNMGVPGAFVYDILNATSGADCFQAVNGGGENPMFDLILRGIGTQFTSTRMLQPTFVTLWIGNNDILGHATTGGTVAYTPEATFGYLYGQLADSIASLGCDVVVANIPSVKAIPFFTTIGPKTGLAIQEAFDAGVINGIYFQANDGTVDLANPITPTDLFTKADLITLKGGAYAPYLGVPTGKFYTDNGYPAIPAGIDTTQAFGFHPANPWPNALLLDADEIAIVDGVVDTYNATIATIAADKGFKLVDIYTFFNDVNANGYDVLGQELSADYITGGVFGLDGVHPGSKGYAVITNEFLKVINTEFNAEIPMINIATIPGSIPVVE